MKKKTKRLTIKQVKSMGRERGIELTDEQIKIFISEVAPYIVSVGKRNAFTYYSYGPDGVSEIKSSDIKDKETYDIINERGKAEATELHCFVGHNFDKRKTNYIRPVLNDTFAKLKIVSYYADEVLTDKYILEKVFKEILKNDFAIFEITNLKPNVAIEIGAALIKDKTSVFLIKKRNEPPEELKGRDMIFYSSKKNLISQLFNKLPGFLKEKNLL